MRSIDVYGKENCRYCKDAVTLLDHYELPYVYRDVADEASRLEVFRRNPATATFPQIFIGETLIGGCDDLVATPLSRLQQMIGE
ncbi:glutaredoxin [Phyllobacterium myrsinacearum]|uniref:Glutaredoxin 3 n=1 Tax=Phyllobacterium myrsinacearum TaxID=28101 RepID=A0A839ENR0_9HYPH|nr:glutaredoxin [Phyllobacterium myrsinacearum]MBA8881721.1 glutaredoxin 3 [Phyllobacterium myrsinacearum]